MTARLAFGFHNPNHAAALACALLPLCWGWRRAAWVGRSLALALFAAVLLTQSRTGLLVAVLEGAAWWTLRRRARASGVPAHPSPTSRAVWTNALGLVALLSLALWRVGPRLVLDGSILNRPRIWLAGLRLFAANPDGVGLGNSGALASAFLLDRDAAHLRGRRVEDAAGVARVRAAEAGPPGGEEVRGLAARRVAVEEKPRRRDAILRGEGVQRVEERAPRPGLRLPVGVVPQRRRDEKDAVQVGPRRPAGLPGDFGPPVGVAPTEEDEDAPPLAAGRVVAARHAIPDRDDGVVRRARRDLDAADLGLRRAGGDRPRRREGRKKREGCQSSEHVTGTPFGTR